jgi:hypothetical protein
LREPEFAQILSLKLVVVVGVHRRHDVIDGLGQRDLVVDSRTLRIADELYIYRTQNIRYANAVGILLE